MSGKMKNTISFLLVLVLFASLFSLPVHGEGETSGSCGAQGNNLTWSYVSGTLTISGTGAMADYTGLAHAPWQAAAADIKRIVVSQGVTSIGDFAFFETNGVEDLYLPEGITKIGDSALKGCSGLKELVLPSTLAEIGDRALQGLSRVAVVTYAGTGAMKAGISIGENNSALDIDWTYVSALSALVYVSTPSPQQGTLVPQRHYAEKGEQVNYTLSMNSGWEATLITADHGTVNMTQSYVKIDTSGEFSSVNFTVTETLQTTEVLLRKWAANPDDATDFTYDDESALADDFVLPEGKNIIIKGGMSLSPGKRFEQNGTIVLSQGSMLSINGTTDYICNSGITVYGILTGGKISLGSNGTIDVYAGGEVRFPLDKENMFTFPQGTTPVYVHAPSAVISGVPSAAVKAGGDVSSWEELKAWLDFASTGVADKVILNIAEAFSITVPEDCTIPSNTELHCSGTLKIPDGVTLENRGSLLLDGSAPDNPACGTLTVEEGGVLENSGTIIVREDNLSGKDNINNTGTLRIILSSVTVSTETELREALEYTPVEITVSGNLDVTDNLIIPENATLIVPGGCSLHVDAGKSLVVNGTLINHGAVYAFGGCYGNRPDGNSPVTGQTGILDMGSCGAAATDSILWKLTEEGCLKITGTGAMKDYSVSTVPWAALSVQVTSLEIQGPSGIGNGVLESVLEPLGEFYAEGRPCTPETLSLPEDGTLLLTAYTYNDAALKNDHTGYPTGMKVWLLAAGEASLSFRPVTELENILQYAGSSIRITGVKGIRMITGIATDKKAALTGEGLAGYTLEEYGTVLAFAENMEEGSLVLSDSYARSNYAYKKDRDDPIFKQTDTQVQYTNVLVGFSDEQCGKDIAMRPYMILRDAEGNQITVYGGTVYRSIGYIAWQNRNAFATGTEAYEYIQHLIEIGYDE